jgi:Protein of Unknown function (DUF2784)
MLYHMLADVVVAVHLAYVSYILFGEILIVIGIPLRWGWIRNKWFRISHLLMILTVAGEAIAEIDCPLTVWEQDLLEAAGDPIESRSFVGRLMHDWMFFDCPDNDWIWPWIYCGFASLVLATLVIAPPRMRRPRPPVGQDSAPVQASE